MTGVAPAEGEATATGPGGDVTLAESQERELTLRDVAGLRIQTAIIEQLIVTSSPVPIETVLQTIPGEDGAVAFTAAGLAALEAAAAAGGPGGELAAQALAEGEAGAGESSAVTVEGEAGETVVVQGEDGEPVTVRGEEGEPIVVQAKTASR